MSTTRTIVWLLGGLTLLTTGCGPELVGAGQVRTVATSEEEGASSSSSPSGSGASYSYSLAAEEQGEAQGTVSFDARVALVTASGAEVQLTNGIVPGTFRMEGADSTELGRSSVRAQTYTHARVTFTRVDANVTGGVMIGGAALTGDVRVQIGSGESVVVERQIDLTVRDEGAHQLVIDLNAHSWLATANPVTRVVTAASFRSAVEVRAVE